MRAYKYLQSTGASTRCCLPGELPLPPLPPLHPLLPLTFSLQPQVLQLEYLYADALSTCSSCFPSFTLVPLQPFPLPFSLCSHNLCSLRELIPARETAAYLFLWVLAYSTAQPYPECFSAPPPPVRSPFNPTLTESIGVSGFCYDCRGFWL